MQNETQNETQNKPKQTISFSNLPSIIVAVIFIVGIGAVFGLLGYLVSGIKENITPVTQKPSVKITNDYFGNDFIQVKSPQKNATVKNPVLISGKANVDEANVRIKITDDNENILADTFITADGWMDKLYPFEKEISYGTPQTENGLIEIFEESARDGSEIYKIEVPVVFEDYEDKAISHLECSDDNPPSIYDGGRKTYIPSLNLCGEKTEFPAYEFEKENFILFVDKRNDDHKSRTCSLKTISTNYPFEEKILGEKIKINDSFPINNLFEKEGLYFWGEFGDGPGSYTSIFMFEPESKEFIHCVIVRKFMSDIDIKIASSKSSVLFNAEKKPRRLLDEDEDFLSDDDIEIIINNEKLSKKDINDGHLIENQEAIFDCRPLAFMVPESDYYDHPDRYPDNYEERINRGEINIRRYIKYFPDKFPCFVNEESDEITGYFDLVENKFVPASDLEQ